MHADCIILSEKSANQPVHSRQIVANLSLQLGGIIGDKANIVDNLNYKRIILFKRHFELSEFYRCNLDCLGFKVRIRRLRYPLVRYGHYGIVMHFRRNYFYLKASKPTYLQLSCTPNTKIELRVVLAQADTHVRYLHLIGEELAALKATQVHIRCGAEPTT